jgi:hypothetical protein
MSFTILAVSYGFAVLILDFYWSIVLAPKHFSKLLKDYLRVAEKLKNFYPALEPMFCLFIDINCSVVETILNSVGEY